MVMIKFLRRMMRHKAQIFFTSIVLILSWFFLFPPSSAARDYLEIKKTAAPLDLEVNDEFEITIQVRAPSELPSIHQPLDLILLLDRSYSMIEYQDQRFNQALQAASFLLSQLDPQFDRAAIISFATHARQDQGWSNDFAFLEKQISFLSPAGYTNLAAALEKAALLLKSRRRQAQGVVVILTDGWANRPLNQGAEDLNFAREQARREAQTLTAEGNLLYSISLGRKKVDRQLLRQLAAEGGGEYFHAPDPQKLAAIYNDLALKVTRVAAQKLRLIDELPPYLRYRGSQDSPPAAVQKKDDQTLLVWRWGLLSPGENRRVSFRVQALRAGDNLFTNGPNSRLVYQDYAGEEKVQFFPRPQINVHSPAVLAAALSPTPLPSSPASLSPEEEEEGTVLGTLTVLPRTGQNFAFLFFFLSLLFILGGWLLSLRTRSN